MEPPVSRMSASISTRARRRRFGTASAGELPSGLFVLDGGIQRAASVAEGDPSCTSAWFEQLQDEASSILVIHANDERGLNRSASALSRSLTRHRADQCRNQDLQT